MAWRHGGLLTTFGISGGSDSMECICLGELDRTMFYGHEIEIGRSIIYR